MNRHLFRIKNDIRDTGTQAWAWFKELTTWAKALVVLAIIGILYLLVHVLGGNKAPEAVIEKANRAVVLSTVAELSSNSTPIPLTGTVTSRSEASVRAEASGQITVYKKLGDYVYAGGIIATFENSGERAQVVQAEGAYDQAKAGRDIAMINRGGTGGSLAEAKVQALNTLSSAYASLDDAIRTKTDVVFSNPQNNQIKFIVSVPDQALIANIERERTQIESILIARAARNHTLSANSDLITELTMLETETKQIKNYLDEIANALNHAVPDQRETEASIEGAKGSTNGARSTVAGVLSSITASRNSVNSALTASEAAGKNDGTTSTGGSAASDAQVKSALGNLQAAQSRLEKTVVRSPISGSVNSLSVKTGDFVSSFSPIAVVSNNGALEVVAYVTDTDVQSIVVGSKVIIDGNVDGVVTKVAPALDPVNKKIEVRIGISGTNGALINGKSVRVDVMRAKTGEIVATEEIRLPLSAIKITPNGSYVFTVDADKKLVAHQIKEGTLMGDQLIILEGVTHDMKIVTDARGLKEGMAVTVK